MLEVVRTACHDKQRSCVDKHKVQDRREMRGNIISRRKQRLECRRILRRRRAFNIAEWMRGQSKVCRRQRSLAYAAIVEQLPHVRVARAGDLVQVLGPAYDIGTLHARGLERRNEGWCEGGLCDAEDHPMRPRRVDQRAKDVHEGAEGQRAPRWSEGGECWVVVWCENEEERDVWDGRGS